MAVKLLSLTLPKRTPNWVSLNAYLSSLSCAVNFQPTQERDQTQSDSTEFESKIQFLKSKLQPDSLISVLDNTPDLNSSLNLFKWASLQKRFQHTAETYHMMILKLGMAGNVEEMEGFCSDMVRDKCRGFEKSLLSLIDSFVSNHRLSEALRVLYVMNLSSFKPTLGIFNALMSALVDEKRDFKDVLFVYKEMVKAGIIPNIDTLNYLLEALFEAGKIDTAIDQYKRMGKKGCKPNIRTFEILISGLATNTMDRVEESIVILNEMFQCGCEPDFSFHTRLIPVFCRLHNLEMGLRLFKMMRASNIAPDFVTYRAMIRCLCEYLQMDDAIKLFEEMIDSSLVPDNQVYLDIINGFCKLNKFTEARNFLEDKNVLDISVHNAILGSYCNSGSRSMAEDMFDEMFERNITDDRSCNILIRFLCENAVMNKALEYLCKMVVSSFHPDSATYSALILGNCKTGKVAEALGLFSHITSKCWVLDFMCYGELVECLCQRGNIEEAVKVYRYMSGKGWALKSKSLNFLIEKMCESGEVNGAIKLLSLTHYTGTTSLGPTYNNILRGLSNSGQESYILATLSQMIVNGCAFDVETYCILIKSMTALNRIGDCISLFNLMISHDLLPDSKTLACLLSYLATYSRVHLIFSSIDKLAKKFEILDSTLYNKLINSLWIEEHKSEASHFLDLMLEKGWVPDASTHVLVMGSNAKMEMASRKSVDEKFGAQDNVSCILAEGLGET